MDRAILVCRIVEDFFAQNSCLTKKTKMCLKAEWSLKRGLGHDNTEKESIENMGFWLNT